MKKSTKALTLLILFWVVNITVFLIVLLVRRPEMLTSKNILSLIMAKFIFGFLLLAFIPMVLLTFLSRKQKKLFTTLQIIAAVLFYVFFISMIISITRLTCC